jgi:hypothetical protein
MKKLLIITFTLVIGLGAFAQHPGARVGRIYSRPRVSIGIGAYVPIVPYYGFGYGPFYPYPSYYNGYGHRPTKLDLTIEDIKNDYQDKIWSAKHDDSLSRKARRQKIHELKHERDAAIIDARKNYYKR